MPTHARGLSPQPQDMSETNSNFDSGRPRYMISVAAELVGMHPQTLRIYEQKGLVRPKRTAGNTRLYSDEDVARLQLIQRPPTRNGLKLASLERGAAPQA